MGGTIRAAMKVAIKADAWNVLRLKSKEACDRLSQWKKMRNGHKTKD